MSEGVQGRRVRGPRGVGRMVVVVVPVGGRVGKDGKDGG